MSFVTSVTVFCETSWIGLSASRQVNSALFFFNSCYFHNVDFSHCGVPRCAPGIGGTTQIWGMLKKFRRCLCPSTAKPCRHLWFIASPIRFDSTELNWPVKLRWVGSLECSWQKVPRTSRYRYRENGNACGRARAFVPSNTARYRL